MIGTVVGLEFSDEERTRVSAVKIEVGVCYLLFLSLPLSLSLLASLPPSPASILPLSLPFPLPSLPPLAMPALKHCYMILIAVGEGID